MSNKVHPGTDVDADDAITDDQGIDVYLAGQYAKWRAWMSKGPVFYMDITNALLSLVSCFDFVISTYNVVDNSAIDTVENVLLIIFIIDYLLRIAMSEYPATYISSSTALVDLSTIVPGIVEIGIGSNSGGVSLGFLRVIRVLRVLKLLRLQRLASASSLLYQQYVLITVTIFTIMFISAGIMQVLDGQIPKLTILPYFDYLYMNVVLLSTVGYGDIVPITPQNKLFVLVLLATAGSIVSVQVRNVSQYIVFKNTYRDSKYVLTARPHIVISGDHPDELTIFLSEFFHPDHGDNMTDVVIFSYHPPDPSIIPKIGLQTQGNLIEYVQVQPGEYTELLRTRADRANAVFILNSAAAYEQPRELDNRVSLYMVLVKQFLKSNSALEVPVHAQLILKESVLALRSMMQYMFGTTPYDFVSCSDDLRLCLAGRSLTCPGFSFVFNSLLRSFSDTSVTDAHEKLPNMPDWMAACMQSCTQEMYHVKASPEMSGTSFTHLALCSMYMSSSLLFGVVTILGHNQSFRPNPLDLCIAEDHILAIFASDQEGANSLVSQLSMVLMRLSDTPDAETALTLIQAAEGTGSNLRSHNQQNLSAFLAILREMQHNLHRGHHSSLPSPPRPSSPDSSDRASIDKKRRPFADLSSPDTSTSALHDIKPRLGRSSTFSSAVGESFLPMSRRNSQLLPEHQPPSSPSLHPPHTPLSRINSATSHAGSPLLRATLGKAADQLTHLSGASGHRLVKKGSFSSRDRRDSDSSAGVSSVSRTSDSQQRKLRSKFMARPGLLMRRKLIEDVRPADAIDEESDDDDASSTPEFVNPSHLSEIERTIQLAEQGAVSFNDVGGAHYSLQQPIPVDCVYVTPKDIEGMSDHFIIFIWSRNFSQIVEYLRLRLLSTTRCVLLVTDKPLSSTQWFLVGRYVGIKVLLGSCSDTQLLVHAGAERAMGIVVLPQQAHASTSPNNSVVATAAVESASILIYNMCKKLENNICCFIEVADSRSFAFLSRDKTLINAFGSMRNSLSSANLERGLVAKASNKDRYHQKTAKSSQKTDDPLHGSGEFLSSLAEPSFVGGEVVVSSVFTTLIAQVYFKPLLSSFVNWVTNSGQDADDEPVDELIGVLAKNCGVTGTNLLAAKVTLLKQHGAMIIALRRTIPGAPKSTYTVVNPVTDCVLQDSDMLLLVSSKPIPSSWSLSPGNSVEVWKESQLLYESWKLRSIDQDENPEHNAEGSGNGDHVEEEESSVLLVDLVEVALSLMREVTSLAKQVAQHNRVAHHSAK